MTEVFELPPRPAPTPPCLDAFRDQLCEELLAAIVTAPAGLVFPAPEPLGRHYGIAEDVARTLRDGLTELGYLQRGRTAYLTAHP